MIHKFCTRLQPKFIHICRWSCQLMQGTKFIDLKERWDTSQSSSDVTFTYQVDTQEMTPSPSDVVYLSGCFNIHLFLLHKLQLIRLNYPSPPILNVIRNGILVLYWSCIHQRKQKIRKRRAQNSKQFFYFFCFPFFTSCSEKFLIWVRSQSSDSSSTHLQPFWTPVEEKKTSL